VQDPCCNPPAAAGHSRQGVQCSSICTWSNDDGALRAAWSKPRCTIGYKGYTPRAVSDLTLAAAQHREAGP
jgi:hypothetical protein